MLNDWLLAHEPAVRLAAFVGVFALMALAEATVPRRQRRLPRRVRWPSNLALVAVNTLAVRLVFPFAAVGFASLVGERGWGLLNALGVPFWLAFLVAVIALDMVIYAQHVMFHAVPWLWRLHRVHHADADVDVTTGARFHPIEILLSMLIKLATVALLGAPAAAVLLFEIVLNAAAMFNHANLKLPGGIDRALRWVIVTPEMHRIHHSQDMAETNSNYGFNLTWWDRLFGTYRAVAARPQETMPIGVDGITGSDRAVKLGGLLVLPFLDEGRRPKERA